MDKQPLRILPATMLGKWSIGLVLAMPLLFITGTSLADSLYVSVPAGGSIGADLAARPALALTILAGMTSGVLAFMTGLLAVIRHAEKAVLVYVSSAIGLLLILFLLGEMLFAH